MIKLSPAASGIDRLSPEPFYLQLSRLVEQAIDMGEFRSGERLPGESDFCRRYDLARSTVREMLRNLQERGRIKMIPRRGAYVAEAGQSGWALQVTASFFEGEVDFKKRRVETAVLEAECTSFAPVIAASLRLAEGEKGFCLRRLRRLDGKLALYSENFLLPELEGIILGSEVMAPHGSLNRVLRSAGYIVFGARRSVEAVPAPVHVARLLEVRPKSPLLLVTSLSWSKDQRPFDYYRSWVKTDVVPITIEAQAVLDTH